MKPVIAATPDITWFEITTALAFLYFARRQVDVAVVEVGLGGRLDATNVVRPQVTVITSLSYDHMALLGDTLSKIAVEKAGIIKPTIPVVLSPQKEEADQAVASIAELRNAPLIRVGQDVCYAAVSHTLDGQEFRVWQDGETPGNFKTPLLGAHQLENAACAYAALRSVNETGIAVSVDAIRQGFREVCWPGRFEILRREPPVVVDSAHNRDSARRLWQAVEDYFPRRNVVLVFGASEDKDIAGMLAELLPNARQVVFTRSIHPRAMSPERLAELARPYGLEVFTAQTIEAAIEMARDLADAQQSLLLVAGSLFIAAAARSVWQG
jgi:dihydrofolate synthase/folylpolyglutamate synthase